MSYFSNYVKGQWLVICDVCGRKFKSSQVRQRWDGLKTCAQDWEMRQPQDFVHGVADIQAPPFTRAESSNRFVLPELNAFSQLLSRVSPVLLTRFIFFESTKKEVNASPINDKTIG
jgi:hypothetical protein